jgi:hypothetical protein
LEYYLRWTFNFRYWNYTDAKLRRSINIVDVVMYCLNSLLYYNFVVVGCIIQLICVTGSGRVILLVLSPNPGEMLVSELLMSVC